MTSSSLFSIIQALINKINMERLKASHFLTLISYNNQKVGCTDKIKDNRNCGSKTSHPGQPGNTYNDQALAPVHFFVYIGHQESHASIGIN